MKERNDAREHFAMVPHWVAQHDRVCRSATVLRVYAALVIEADFKNRITDAAPLKIVQATGLSRSCVYRDLGVLREIRAIRIRSDASIWLPLDRPEEASTGVESSTGEDGVSSGVDGVSTHGDLSFFTDQEVRGERGAGSDDPAQRPDVERLCILLADLVEGNGSRRPVITNTWRRECRLLLDKDGRSIEQVEVVIRWCQGGDSFWKKNCLSMPKLRERFDQIRLERNERLEKKAKSSGVNTNLGVLQGAHEREKARAG